MSNSIYIHPYEYTPDSRTDIETRILLTKEDVVSMYRILSFYYEVTRDGHRGLDDMIIHDIDKRKGFAWLRAIRDKVSEIRKKKVETLRIKEDEQNVPSGKFF